MNRIRSNKAYKNKSKKNLMKIFLVLLIAVIVVSIRPGYQDFDKEKLMESYVSVDEVVSELSFFVYTREEWQDFFADYKEAYLTRGMVFDILGRLGVSGVIAFDEVGKQQAVDRTEWNGIYGQLLDYLDIENRIEKKEFLVLSGEDNETGNVLYTNIGTFSSTLPATYFSEWGSYEVYVLGTECVGIIGETETEAVIPNTYVTAAADGRLSFLFDGRHYEKEANMEGVAVAEGVADITVQNFKVTTVSQKQDYIEGRLLSYDDTTIEIEGYGRIAHQGKLPVYRAYDKVEELSVSDIILGNMDVKYIIGREVVCAILITAPAEIDYVRVLLLAPEGGNFREEVYLTCNSGVTISCGERTMTAPAGMVIGAKEYISSAEETLVVTPESGDALLYLCDADGNEKSNGYSGTLEIRQYPDGYCVVNEVPLETYLYSVVPSEMPSSYQPEALKAQAVCARSYAYIQVLRSDLAAYGAHINDSTSYQVYNNIPKTEASVRAVDETAGMVMLYEGDVIEAYYFSTSMGYTDTAEVWNVLEEADYAYLKRACLNHQTYEGNLSEEADFKAYLAADMTGYESEIKFYRWQAEADYSGRTEEIKDILETRRNAVNRHITYYKADGTTEADSMEGFGGLETIEVAGRSASGAILTLQVRFENGMAEVRNEYNIRRVLACGVTTITYKDGSTGESLSLLPSPFCTVERQEDGGYLLHGGGYGHGLGMSQNGANGLAKNGYSYADILNYFYNGIELVDIRL